MHIPTENTLIKHHLYISSHQPVQCRHSTIKSAIQPKIKMQIHPPITPPPPKEIELGNGAYTRNKTRRMCTMITVICVYACLFECSELVNKCSCSDDLLGLFRFLPLHICENYRCIQGSLMLFLRLSQVLIVF